MTARQLDLEPIRSRRQVVDATVDMTMILAGQAALRPKLMQEMAMAAARSCADVPGLLDEVERLRGAATEIERLSDTYMVEGTGIVMQRIIDLRRERDEARAAVDTAVTAERERIAAAVEAERDECVATLDDQMLYDRGVLYGLAVAHRIAGTLPDGGNTDD